MMPSIALIPLIAWVNPYFNRTGQFLFHAAYESYVCYFDYIYSSLYAVCYVVKTALEKSYKWTVHWA